MRFAPATLRLTANGPGGGKCLTCVGPTVEEVHCTGVRTEGCATAIAVAVRVAADAPGHRDTVLGVGPTVPGIAAEHRSFWQTPDVRAVRLTDETACGVRTRRMDRIEPGIGGSK